MFKDDVRQFTLEYIIATIKQLSDYLEINVKDVYNKFKEIGITSKILLQVHDEIIVDCKNSELNLIKKIIKEEMEQVCKLEVPLKVEIDTGTNWYEAK